MKRDEDFVTIKEEFDSLNSYLSIEHARFGNRLKVNINIDERLNLLYGDNCELKIDSLPDKGTCVQFTISKEIKK